jgi:hypothetical protein
MTAAKPEVELEHIEIPTAIPSFSGSASIYYNCFATIFLNNIVCKNTKLALILSSLGNPENLGVAIEISTLCVTWDISTSGLAATILSFRRWMLSAVLAVLALSPNRDERSEKT